MPSSTPSPRTPRAVMLPPDRIMFSALAALLGISRSTLQRRYRPGAKNPTGHTYWRNRLDIRRRIVAEKGAVRTVLHCSRPACGALRRELVAAGAQDLPAD